MGYINDGYGWRIHPITGKRTWHNGVDYTTSTGVPITTNVPMTVVNADPEGVQKGFGNIVVLRDQSGNTYKYAHLDAMNVKAGQEIPSGTLIGWVGNTGGSTGSHLHTEAANSSGKSVDPNSINPATGKPWTAVVGFEPGKTLNESIKNATPDKNRPARPTTPAEPSKPQKTLPEIQAEREREKNKTGPGSNNRPRPAKSDVGIIINPRHILGDGG